MIIKKKKGSLFILPALILILVACIAVSIIAYNQNKEELEANFQQKIQSFDLGYSTPQSLSTVIKDLPRIISYKLGIDPSAPPPLERIDIDIAFADYQVLLEDRRKLLLLKGLAPHREVPATIRHQNKNIKAKVRLKGDQYDHWLSHYRMSLRVSLKGSNSILGFKKFSLHKPESRQFPADHLYTESMRAAGVLAPVHKYLRVYVNGTSWGIMDVEEQISTEMLEKQRVKDSLVVKFEASIKDLLVVIFEAIINDEKRYSAFEKLVFKTPPYPMYRGFDPRLNVELYESDSRLADIVNRKRLTYIAEERLKRNHTHLYDIEAYSRALILASIWNDGHPLADFNSRHYFNPYTLTLEPIPSDSIGPVPISIFGFMPRREFDPFFNNDIYNQVISTEEYKTELVDNFKFVSNSLNSISEAAKTVNSYFPLDRNVFATGTLFNNANVLARSLKGFLAPPNPNSVAEMGEEDSDITPSETPKYVHIVRREDGRAEVYNMVPDTVYVSKIMAGSKNLLSGFLQLEPYKPRFREPQIIKIPGNRSSLSAVVQYNGHTVVDKIDPPVGRMEHFIPPNPRSFPMIPLPTELDLKLLAGISVDLLHVRHYKDGRMLLFNTLPETVSLVNILLDGNVVSDIPVHVPAYEPGDYSPITIETGLKGIFDGRITVQTNYRGFNNETEVGPTLVAEGLENPLLRKTDDQLPFLKKKDSGAWEIVAGTWDITVPLVVQGNLTIQPGTSLRFAKDSFLLVNKGALTAEGFPGLPITFGPIGEEWRGIYVNRAPRKSSLENVIVSKTKELTAGLLELTGAVTFYRAEVSLENVVFDTTLAEDALNIVKSPFLMNHVKVMGTRSDGVDFDFSDGKVVDSYLGDIGDDALDFSGSKVEIIRTEVEKAKDKAVSAGEATNLNIINLTARDVGVGVASKDGSNVRGDNIRVVNYTLHAVMAYKKKDFYDFPAVEIANLVSQGSADQYSAQRGSRMVVNGEWIEEEDIDVKQLYQTEFMKK